VLHHWWATLKPLVSFEWEWDRRSKQSYLLHRKAKLNWQKGKVSSVVELEGQFRFFKSPQFESDPDFVGGLRIVDADGGDVNIKRFLAIQVWDLKRRNLSSYPWKTKVSYHHFWKSKHLFIISLLCEVLGQNEAFESLSFQVPQKPDPKKWGQGLAFTIFETF